MTRNRILASIATIAIVASAPTLAKPGGGGGGMGGGQGASGANAGAGTMGGISGTGSTMRDMGRANSQGPANASPNALERVNSNSVLSTTTDDAGSTTRIRGQDRIRSNADAGSTTTAMGQGKVDLSGVTDGMTVVDSTGATVGTVTDISTRGNSGKVRNVEVTLTDGTVISLAPNSLTLEGDVLTTTSLESTANASNRRVNSQGPAHANINGLTHANPNSVLGGAGVTTLTGLTTGLTVNNSAAVSIGTVDQVILNKAGAVVGIRVALTGGGTVTIPANMLTINGTIVTTTQAGL